MARSRICETSCPRSSRLRTAHTSVADGASERLHAVLGERGAAARSAIGVASLPSGAPLEVELVAAVRGPGQ